VVLDAGDQSHGLRQSYGVARAAELQKRRCWVIKGVCDLADVKKDDAAHPTAAANAAEVLSTLISGGAFAYVDRRDLAMAGSDFFSKLPGGNDLLTAGHDFGRPRARPHATAPGTSGRGRFLNRNDPQAPRKQSLAPVGLLSRCSVSSTLRSGSKHLASQSTDRGASCSYAAMGARENFDSGSRVESAHRGY
jgi:hypothetical protein